MSKMLKQRLEVFKDVLDQFPEVRYAGDPILRQVAQEVTLQEGLELGEKLGEVLMRYRKAVGYGRGLAAPQIGESKSVFVTFIDEQFEVFINPKIIEVADKINFYRELCLSCGVMVADVERPEWVVMEWTNKEGERRQEKSESFLARLRLHEESHLRGKLNLDEAVPGGIGFLTFDPLKEQLRSTR